MVIAGLAGVIRGITGFGGAMVLTPPLALLLGLRLAIPVVLLLEAFAGAPMMRDAARRATWRTLTPITLAALVTIPLGGYVLVHADQDLLRRAIARSSSSSRCCCSKGIAMPARADWGARRRPAPWAARCSAPQVSADRR